MGGSSRWHGAQDFLTYWYGDGRPAGEDGDDTHPEDTHPEASHPDGGPGSGETAAQLAVVRRWPEALTGHILADPAPHALNGTPSLLATETSEQWHWGVDSHGEVSERPGPASSAGPWLPLGEDVGAFLLHLVVAEAVWGARRVLSAADLSGHELAHALAGFLPVPVHPWRWPGPRHRLWHREDLLAFSCVDAAPTLDPHPPLPLEESTAELRLEAATVDEPRLLMVAARTPEALDSMWRRPVDWTG